MVQYIQYSTLIKLKLSAKSQHAMHDMIYNDSNDIKWGK